MLLEKKPVQSSKSPQAEGSGLAVFQIQCACGKGFIAGESTGVPPQGAKSLGQVQGQRRRIAFEHFDPQVRSAMLHCMAYQGPSNPTPLHAGRAVEPSKLAARNGSKALNFAP